MIDTIYARIRDIRREKKLSQAELASRSHMTRDAIASIECGRRRVTSTEVAKLSEGLGVQPEDILASGPRSFLNQKANAEASPEIESAMVSFGHYIETSERLKRLSGFVEGADGRARILRRELDLGDGRVDPVAILRSLGVEVMVSPLPEQIDVDGKYRREDVGAYVLINASRPALVQRFTAAHELGHYLLDSPPHRRVETPAEKVAAAWDDEYHHREVNVFAAALLIDAEAAQSLFDEGHRGLGLIGEVVARFEIDADPAGRYLASLKLVAPAEAEAARSLGTEALLASRGLSLPAYEPVPVYDPAYYGRVMGMFVSGMLNENSVADALEVSREEACAIVEANGAAQQARDREAELSSQDPFLAALEGLEP